MTVKQNAMYGIKGCKDMDGRYKLSVLDVMEMLKITHLQDRYPVSLSGGEKQRVALARALMTEPDLLLLDEPLAALDDKTRRQLRGELKELQRRWQIPFIIVTHDRTELNYLADAALFLRNGKPYRVLNRNKEQPYD
jgi:molybdate transport system ATP-binding protein